MTAPTLKRARAVAANMRGTYTNVTIERVTVEGPAAEVYARLATCLFDTDASIEVHGECDNWRASGLTTTTIHKYKDKPAARGEGEGQ